MRYFSNGYVALVSVLIGSLVSLAIFSTISVDSAHILNNLSSKNESVIGRDHLNSCADDSLMRLNESTSLPSSIIIEDYSCTITINSQSGDNWDYTISTSYEGFNYLLRIILLRTDKIYIDSWEYIK